MSEDIESQMRAALRSVSPSEEFTQKLLANVASQRPAALEARRVGARLRPLAWWFSASLAASLMLAVGIHQHLQPKRSGGAPRGHGGAAGDEPETESCIRSSEEPIDIADKRAIRRLRRP
jgi:hypothetical protein